MRRFLSNPASDILPLMHTPMTHMMRIGTGTFLLCGSILLAGNGCGNDTQASGPTTPAVASPGAAPTGGTQSGMGFATGNAHSDASGSGLMGFPLGPTGTGAMGTSSAISDNHPIGAPTFPTTEPVLPAP